MKLLELLLATSSLLTLQQNGVLAGGWNFFPWNVWNKNNSQQKIKNVIPQKKHSTGTVEPRIAKQRWAAPSSQKEIIDLEEAVCLPRYQCGKKYQIICGFQYCLHRYIK